MARVDSNKMNEQEAPESEVPFGLPRPSRRLAALTTSALALPGIAGTARADAPVERAEASYAFSLYLEDDLPGQNLADGSEERYEVLTHQFRFDFPVADRVDLGLSMLYEEMSGASPWFVVASTTTGEPLQVMSGATIEDERFDMTLDADFFLDNGKDTFAAGFSRERDYLSVHAGISAERNFNDKNTTISASGAFSYDWIEPTDAERFGNRQNTGEKWAIDLFASFSQILSRSTTGQITINYKHADGYLADPYKEISQIGGGNLPDRRPDQKDQVSILGRLRQHVEPLNASIHLDYRFYADTYKVTSHTVEFAWYQSIFDFITIAPSVRYYSQSKAEFYDIVLPPGVIRGNASSDFRLSPYGAFSTRLKIEGRLSDMIRTSSNPTLERFGVTGGIDLFLALSYERYLSDGAYALTSVSDFDEAPGLVGFQIFAATLTGRF